MQKLKMALVVIASVSFPPSVWSSTEELDQAVYSAVPFLSPTYVDRDKRRELVLAVQNYWNSFDSRVPKLSPSEYEWVQTELGGEGERLNRVLRSREAALYYLGISIGACVSAANDVAESLALEEHDQTEMFRWLSVVECYAGMDQILGHLSDAQLSNGRYDGEFYAAGAPIIVVDLLRKVIPSAMADTMGWKISDN